MPNGSDNEANRNGDNGSEVLVTMLSVVLKLILEIAFCESHSFLVNMSGTVAHSIK